MTSGRNRAKEIVIAAVLAGIVAAVLGLLALPVKACPDIEQGGWATLPDPDAPYDNSMTWSGGGSPDDSSAGKQDAPDIEQNGTGGSGSKGMFTSGGQRCLSALALPDVGPFGALPPPGQDRVPGENLRRFTPVKFLYSDGHPGAGGQQSEEEKERLGSLGPTGPGGSENQGKKNTIRDVGMVLPPPPLDPNTGQPVVGTIWPARIDENGQPVPPGTATVWPAVIDENGQPVPPGGVAIIEPAVLPVDDGQPVTIIEPAPLPVDDGNGTKGTDLPNGGGGFIPETDGTKGINLPGTPTGSGFLEEGSQGGIVDGHLVQQTGSTFFEETSQGGIVDGHLVQSTGSGSQKTQTADLPGSKGLAGRDRIHIPDGVVKVGGGANTAPPPPGPVAPEGAKVLSVTGSAQRLVFEGQREQWLAVAPGETLGPLTVVRTGLSSGLVVELPGGERLTIGSATKMGIGQFAAHETGHQPNLTLKYGTLDLQRGHGTASEIRVETPAGLLSFTGDRGGVGYSHAAGLKLNGKTRSWRAMDGAKDGRTRLTSEQVQTAQVLRHPGQDAVLDRSASLQRADIAPAALSRTNSAGQGTQQGGTSGSTARLQTSGVNRTVVQDQPVHVDARMITEIRERDSR